MTEILIIKYDDCCDLPYVTPFLRNLGIAFEDLVLTFVTLTKNKEQCTRNFRLISKPIELLLIDKFGFKTIYDHSKNLLKKKFDYTFILDDSVYSILLSHVFSSKKRVAFKKNLLLDRFTNVSVEKNPVEYRCDQYNYMLQKAEIRTPVRNPVHRDLPVESSDVKTAISDNYILFICKNLSMEINWLSDLIEEVKLPWLGLEINLETKTFNLKVKDKTASDFSTEPLDEAAALKLINESKCIFSKDIELYSFFSLYSPKAVLVSSKSDAIKSLFRLFNHHQVCEVDQTKLVALLNGTYKEQTFFDFREDSIGDYKNILVLKTGGLGDLILSYPTVALIKKAWPNSRITALIIPYMLQLAKYNKDFDEVIAYDKQKKKDFRYIFELGNQLKNKNFDAFFLLNRSPRVVMLAVLSRIKDVIGYGTFLLKPFIQHSVFEKDRRKFKVLLQNIDIVRGLGLDVDEIKYGDYQVDESPVIRDFIDENRKNEKIIIINIGGRWPSKKFKPSKWSRLIDALIIKYKKPVFLLWGPDEREIVTEVYKCVNAKSLVFILPSTNMGEVAYSISRSMLFITCDTGAMHIADAMKVPQVVLMGPTSPVRWGPISPQSRIIYKKVPCGPCNTEVCHDHDNICMAQITPLDILLEINEMDLKW